MRPRGQLVLLTAALVALALVPLLTAVVQLGYHPDGTDRAVDPHPVTASGTVLDRAVGEISPRIPRNYSWPASDRAATAVREALGSTTAALERSRIASGTVVGVEVNGSRASDWASRRCPGGPGRDFGTCRAHQGIVLQERRGRAHLVAVAVDIRATGQDGAWRATVVLRPRS